MSEIILSIKPEFVDKIVRREKNHEFRKYTPKQFVDRFWIYVPSPICELKYIADVSTPIIYPDKIYINGYGNNEFNEGLKVSKYAFPINHLYELHQSLSLVRLKIEFNFSPPQGYAYITRYPLLIQYVENQKIRQLF